MTGRTPARLGADWIHGLGERERAVRLPLVHTEGHLLVVGTTGAGKAQPLTSRVHTPSGWRMMGDLRVGDAVSTPDGGSARITGVFPQGAIPIYRVRFVDGRVVEACWRAPVGGASQALEREIPAGCLPGRGGAPTHPVHP